MGRSLSRGINVNDYETTDADRVIVVDGIRVVKLWNTLPKPLEGDMPWVDSQAYVERRWFPVIRGAITCCVLGTILGLWIAICVTAAYVVNYNLQDPPDGDRERTRRLILVPVLGGVTLITCLILPLALKCCLSDWGTRAVTLDREANGVEEMLNEVLVLPVAIPHSVALYPPHNMGILRTWVETHFNGYYGVADTATPLWVGKPCVDPRSGWYMAHFMGRHPSTHVAIARALLEATQSDRVIAVQTQGRRAAILYDELQAELLRIAATGIIDSDSPLEPPLGCAEGKPSAVPTASAKLDAKPIASRALVPGSGAAGGAGARDPKPGSPEQDV